MSDPQYENAAPADPKPRDSLIEWFYEKEGSPQGPLSQVQLCDLASSAEIGGKTLVWTKAFGVSWRPLAEAGIWQQSLASPPALPPRSVTDVFIWLLALTPILGWGLEHYLQDAYPQVALPNGAVIGAYIIFGTVLIALDSFVLRASGRPRASLGLWFWLVPAYLVARARLLKRGWIYLPAWIAAMASSIYIENPDLLSGNVYWGTGIPACDSSVVRNNLTTMLNEAIEFKSLSMTVVRLDKIQQIASSDTVRSCSAEVETSRLSEWLVTYDIQDQGDENIYIKAHFIQR